ncbi:aminotransferase class III-fold pyridoxal phosphate-dependent enzyme [Nitrososphaera sp.]|uniref:aminotransferase class III-fold pyridoxal phosphate-dependent enzyme n=1 Tax=Nitrososphaera sp. TaxID=1971748 RepID=UPI002EDA1637
MGFAKVAANLPGPKAAEIIAVLKRNCYDSTFSYPLVIDGGQGCVIRDSDGNQFLDFTSNIGACPLGYGHPDVIHALAGMAQNGAHKIAGQDFYCREHADLSEKFLSVLPEGFKTFFVNSGAEAVENAVKIAYRKRMKDGMPVLPGVSCTGAFHGRTLGTLSFTFSKPVQKAGFPELPVLRIKFCKEDSDPEIDSIGRMLEQNKVAFVISEVIQGEGGYSVASKKFMQNLRKQADAHGVPLILDEVQSGMGRTGKWWAFEHYDVKPDIMSTAKALQVGAAAFRSDLDPGQQGVLSSTWGGGSRIDMAIGAAIIDAIKRDKLLYNAHVMGGRLKKGLQDLIGKGGVIDVRGIGLMVGIEFDTKESRDAVLARMFRKGLLLLPAGQKAMRAIPPLIITAEEVDEGLEIATSVLS